MQNALSLQLLIAALVLAAIYALIALGLNLIYGTMRLLNVAHGEIMMIGGYACFVGVAILHLPVFVCMLAAMAISAALGLLFYHTLFRYLIANRTLAARLESNSLLLFFGISIILQNLLSLAFSADPRSYPSFNQIVPVGDAQVEATRLIVLVIGAAATIACVTFFRLSWIGIATRALIQQRDADSLVGIAAGRVQVLVFCLGFALAGLAGALVSMQEAITPFSGFSYTISAFIIVILGGLGNLAGGILGAVVLAFIEIYGVALTSPAYRSILVYGVFIAILFLRPQGLLGSKAA